MFNDALQKALSEAQQMQKHITEAANDASEHMKPLVAKSLENAKTLQQTLAAHAAQSGEIATKGGEKAMVQLNEFIRMGNDAMRESAEIARVTALKMVDQSRKVLDAASESLEKKA